MTRLPTSKGMDTPWPWPSTRLVAFEDHGGATFFINPAFVAHVVDITFYRVRQSEELNGAAITTSDGKEIWVPMSPKQVVAKLRGEVQ